ncbi:MAG: choline-sulfatase [Gammaproteobacteria bacterium]|nr:choline-sulfatase [Gammaproteobacteria bacterium]MDH4310140.1 choline-sulfatase [Gammaproteobacteria bacterium]MDH5274223.1 choline-sulfatase [Gammaproteobacteria bacterium]
MNSTPNVLVIMYDQLTPAALGCYGSRTAKSPHIDRLAAAGVVFDAAYTNSPLCTPARYCMMTGQLPSATRGYDNAAYLASTIPTFAHYVRAAGYRTVLAGKMHFVGPDQLHGFEERRTTDIYPADFGWTPDWRTPGERIDCWYHNMGSVTGAGVAEVTNQLLFDDEVGFHALRALHDAARADDGRPFLLVASFTHPHDPYVTRREYWNRYEGVEIPMPAVSAADVTADSHTQRLRAACDMERTPITDDDVRRARRAYFGNISYVDDWTGRLVGTLEALGLADDTIVILLADHGDMLGERGLWYKMSFFEGSARIPLVVHAPARFRARRVSTPVSLVDVLPTLIELSGGAVADAVEPLAGRSLLPLCEGDAEDRTVVGEYAAEGACAPIVMLRRGALKFVHCPVDPDQLYDLATDPGERVNLAGHAEWAAAVANFREEVTQRWDLAQFHSDVLQDQARRRLVMGALRSGNYTPWEFTPRRDASNEYMRNHLDLNDVERSARWPR